MIKTMGMGMIKFYLATVLVTLSISTVNASLVGRLPATMGGTDYQAYYDADLNGRLMLLIHKLVLTRSMVE